MSRATDFVDSVDNLHERKVKKVVRAGHVTRKLFCKPGFKAENGKCVPMTGAEKVGRKIAAKKGARVRKGASKSVANMKRARSNKLRSTV